MGDHDDLEHPGPRRLETRSQAQLHWATLRRRLKSARRIMQIQEAQNNIKTVIPLDGGFEAGMGGRSAEPIKLKPKTVLETITDSHLAMEPLCCMNSCLVTEACALTGYVGSILVIFCSLASIYDLEESGWWWFYEPSLYVNTIIHFIIFMHSVMYIAAFWYLLRGLYIYSFKNTRIFGIIQVISMVTCAFILMCCTLAVWLESYINIRLFVLLMFHGAHLLWNVWAFGVVRDTHKYFHLCRVFADKLQAEEALKKHKIGGRD